MTGNETLQELSGKVRDLEGVVEAQKALISEQRTLIEQQRIALLGDTRYNAPGLVATVREHTVEIKTQGDALSTLTKRMDAQNNMLRGVMIGLSVTGLTGIGTLVTLLTQVAGIGP